MTYILTVTLKQRCIFPLYMTLLLHGLRLTEERWYTKEDLEEHSSTFPLKKAD